MRLRAAKVDSDVSFLPIPDPMGARSTNVPVTEPPVASSDGSRGAPLARGVRSLRIRLGQDLGRRRTIEHQ